jgi:hypothetical protein
MQQLRVNTAAQQAMATNWGASAAELSAAAPIALGPSSQPSAVAVNAAHANVAAFTTDLATRIEMRASHVENAQTSYVAGQATSASELSTLVDSMTAVLP